MNSEERIGLLEVDMLALDRECVQLPSQYLQAADHAADLEHEIGEAENELKVKEAELSLKIRATPGQFHLDKSTEGSIKELLVINPALQKMRANIRELQHKADLAKKLCTAIDYKKRSLTNLVELHSSGYHAQVRPSKEGRETLNKISRDRISRPIPWEKRKKTRDVESD